MKNEPEGCEGGDDPGRWAAAPARPMMISTPSPPRGEGNPRRGFPLPRLGRRGSGSHHRPASTFRHPSIASSLPLLYRSKTWEFGCFALQPLQVHEKQLNVHTLRGHSAVSHEPESWKQAAGYQVFGQDRKSLMDDFFHKNIRTDKGGIMECQRHSMMPPLSVRIFL